MRKKILIVFSISCVILLFFIVAFYFCFPRKYKNYVIEFSNKYELESALVYAITKVESDFNKNAVSKSGAIGLMQILPKTAKWIAEELKYSFDETMLFNPKNNIEFGCFYLRYLFDKFNDMDIVICAYNAGETKVCDWIENDKLVLEKIDYIETKNYLTKVREFYNVYKSSSIFL